MPPRASILALLVGVLAAPFLGACNHCDSLDERICRDLGSDCAMWRSDAVMRGMVLSPNEHRFRARQSACEALGDDAIYASRTLPMLRNYIARKRNPNAVIAPLPTGAPPASAGSLGYYILPLLAVAGIFAYSAYYRKVGFPKAMAAQQAQQAAASEAQARAMAEWQAQQAAANANGPRDPHV